MGLFDWLTGKRRPRRRRVQTSAQAPRRRPRRSGGASKRYLERLEQLEGVQQRRRRPTVPIVQTSAQRRPRPSDRSYDDPTVPIDTRAVERELAKRRGDREKAERQRVRDQERERRAEARMIGRASKARDRAIAAYITHGLSRAEAEQLVDREPEWETFNFNPRRRRVRARGQLRRRTKRNPGVGAVVGEIAKDVVKGSLVAAAQEELKEWRDRRGGFGIVRRTPHRRNPARLEPNHADPRLRAMSERFHGRPDQILHLDEDQRRPPPKHVVLIGQERATVYRVPRGSERSGGDWEHEAGDRGMLRRNASGRRILVADEHGRVYLLQGSSSMRFDPDQGLVG